MLYNAVMVILSRLILGVAGLLLIVNSAFPPMTFTSTGEPAGRHHYKTNRSLYHPKTAYRRHVPISGLPKRTVAINMQEHVRSSFLIIGVAAISLGCFGWGSVVTKERDEDVE